MPEPPLSEPGGYLGDEPAAHDLRRESLDVRLDRNYGELLQELRVAETGAQVLFAFLLSIAFQQRFSDIDTFQRVVYVATLLSSGCSIALLIAPVAFHRLVFRRGLKAELVMLANICALAGMTALLLAVLGGVLLVLDYVVNRPFSIGATAVFAIVFLGLWLALPLWRLRRAIRRRAVPRR